MLGENILMVVEAQQKAERFVKELRASGALDQIQRVQEALRHLEIDRRQLAQFQQVAARLSEIDARLFDEAARVREDLNWVAGIAVQTQARLSDIHRQFQNTPWWALQDNPRRIPSNPLPTHSQKSMPDDWDKSERTELIELFRLRMFIQRLTEDMEDWPPEGWEFPYSEKN